LFNNTLLRLIGMDKRTIPAICAVLASSGGGGGTRCFYRLSGGTGTSSRRLSNAVPRATRRRSMAEQTTSGNCNPSPLAEGRQLCPKDWPHYLRKCKSTSSRDALYRLIALPWKPWNSFKLAYQRARRSFSGSNTRMVCGVNSIRPLCLNSVKVRLNDSAAVPTMAAMSSRVS